ncbi:glycosyltransferase family protein [Vibrio campbellii]|uniref:hypothetical protein n=1 Tax=Vibrio campbellii TaxID=680 RepID=UPI0038CD5FD8
MSDLKVIAPLSSLSNRTRLFKLAIYLNEEKPNVNITHVGWERIAGEREEKFLKSVNISKKILLKGGGYGGRKARAMYALWMVAVFLYCLFFVNSRSTVWALGFESAFPALLAAKIKRYKVIFDDADRFSMVFRFPKPVKALIEYLEEYTSYNVDCHVVPGVTRYDFKSDKMYTLKNLPNKSVVVKAQNAFDSSNVNWPKSKLVIYVNGWLGSSRGMKTALELSNHFSSKDVGFILAGKLDCIEAEELAKKEQVLYLGNVGNEEAISAYFASDFVFTYYDPTSPVNRHAESNKWGDAIATNTAVIVNSEVETADWLVKAGAAISVPYQDTTELIKKLSAVLASGTEVDIFKNNIKRFGNEMPTFFEDGLDDVFSKVI